MSEILKKCVDVLSVIAIAFLLATPIWWGVDKSFLDANLETKTLHMLWGLDVFVCMFGIIWLPIRYKRNISKWLFYTDPRFLNFRFLLVLMVLVGLLRGFVYLVRN